MTVIGVGIDVVDIARVRRMIGKYGDQLLARVCTDAEAAYVLSHADPAARLAVRLAAKEAAFKALAGSFDARAIGWRELEVVAADGGPPSLALHGRARTRLDELGGGTLLLSLSHGDATAIAIVLIQRTLA